MKNQQQLKKKIKKKPNFELSGALASHELTVNGVVLKYQEPIDAKKPNKRWRLYIFKNGETLEPLHIHRQSSYLFGREHRVVDVPIDHPSCSKQHAVLQYRQKLIQNQDTGQTKREIRPYLLDLESTNGSFINGEKIEEKRFYELKEKDILKFGFSTREYVLIREDMQSEAPDDLDS